MFIETNLVTGAKRTFSSEQALIEYIARHNNFRGEDFSFIKSGFYCYGGLKCRREKAKDSFERVNDLLNRVVLSVNDFERSKSETIMVSIYAKHNPSLNHPYGRFLIYHDSLGRVVDIRDYWGIVSTYEYFEMYGSRGRKLHIPKEKGKPVPNTRCHRRQRAKKISIMNQVRADTDPDYKEFARKRYSYSDISYKSALKTWYKRGAKKSKTYKDTREYKAMKKSRDFSRLL